MAATMQFKRITDPEQPDSRGYFSRTELTDTIVVAERGAPAECMPDCPVAEELLRIPGVMLIQLRPYVLTIMKAPTYEWSEIEPSLLRFLTSFNMGEGRLEAEVEA